MPPRTGPLDPGATCAHVCAGGTSTAARVDVVVVMPHWGTQYTHRPEPVQGQVADARAVAEPTWWWVGTRTGCRGWTGRAGRRSLHSLGNFVFDMDFIDRDPAGRRAGGDVLGRAS